MKWWILALLIAWMAWLGMDGQRDAHLFLDRSQTIMR